MPRSGEFKRGGAQPKEESVDDRLHSARPARLHPHPNGFARCLGLARRRRTARRKHLQRRVIDAGMLERRESASPFVFVVHQPLYGCGRHHRGQMVDDLRRAAESGAIEQMPRTCAIPVRRLDRRKIVHPIVFRSHRAVPEISSDRPLSSATIYTAFPLGAHIPSAPLKRRPSAPLKRRAQRPSASIFPTRGERPVTAPHADRLSRSVRPALPRPRPFPSLLPA